MLRMTIVESSKRAPEVPAYQFRFGSGWGSRKNRTTTFLKHNFFGLFEITRDSNHDDCDNDTSDIDSV